MTSDLRKQTNSTSDGAPRTAVEDLIRPVPVGQEWASIEDLPTLQTSWVLHLRAKNLSPRTIQSYGEAAQRLSDFLQRTGQSQRVSDISRRNLEAFIGDQLDRHTPATAANRYRSLKQLFRWLEDEGEVGVSPMRKMRAPAVPEQAVPVVSIEDQRRLLATCGSRSLIDLRDKAILMVFIDTGARLSEVAGLTVDDVELRDRVLYVVGKGNRPRVLPVGDRTVVQVDRYLRKRGQSSHRELQGMWVGRKGVLTTSGITQMIKRRCTATGLPALHPHQFRHTFADTWLAGGGSEGDLMRIVGWRTRDMLNRYGASEAQRRALTAYRSRPPSDRL